MSEEREVLSVFDLEEVIKNISFENSCVDMHWEFDVTEISIGMGIAWLVNTNFERPDTYPPYHISRGKGRQEVIYPGTSESGVVKTIFLLCKMILEHELMEALKYRGERPFDPHNQVTQLGRVSQERREKESVAVS